MPRVQRRPFHDRVRRVFRVVPRAVHRADGGDGEDGQLARVPRVCEAGEPGIQVRLPSLLTYLLYILAQSV